MEISLNSSQQQQWIKLIKTKCFFKSEVIDLYYDKIPSEGAKNHMENPKDSVILRKMGNFAALEFLCKELKEFENLKEFSINFQEIGDEGFQNVLNSLKSNNSIQKLGLMGNNLTEVSATELSKFLADETLASNLMYIELIGNNISEESNSGIQTTLHQKRKQMGIHEQWIDEFNRQCHGNDSELNLQRMSKAQPEINNSLDFILSQLSFQKHFHHLNMKDHCLKPRVLRKIIEAAKTFKHIKTMDLCGNNFFDCEFIQDPQLTKKNVWSNSSLLYIDVHKSQKKPEKLITFFLKKRLRKSLISTDLDYWRNLILKELGVVTSTTIDLSRQDTCKFGIARIGMNGKLFEGVLKEIEKFPRRISRIILNHQEIDDKCAEALCNCLKFNENLWRVDVWGNKITMNGAANLLSFASDLEHPLFEINLMGNLLTDDEVRGVHAKFAWKRRHCLPPNLMESNILKRLYKDLERGHSNIIIHFDNPDCEIASKWMIDHLLETLQDFPSVKTVSLRSSGITDADIDSVGQKLMRLRNVELFDLEGDRISKEGQKLLMSYVHDEESLAKGMKITFQ